MRFEKIYRDLKKFTEIWKNLQRFEKIYTRFEKIYWDLKKFTYSPFCSRNLLTRFGGRFVTLFKEFPSGLGVPPPPPGHWGIVHWHRWGEQISQHDLWKQIFSIKSFPSVQFWYLLQTVVWIPGGEELPTAVKMERLYGGVEKRRRHLNSDWTGRFFLPKAEQSSCRWKCWNFFI